MWIWDPIVSFSTGETRELVTLGDATIPGSDHRIEVLLTGDASKPPFFTLQLGRFHKPQNSGVLMQSTLKSNGFSSKIYPSQVFQQKLLWFDQFSTKKPLVLCFPGFNPSKIGQFQPKTVYIYRCIFV